MTMLPRYSTMLLTDIYSSPEEFVEEYQSNGIPETISVDKVQLLFYLLFARYGNNPIANFSIEQFKARLWSTVFQYGPTWEKRLELQQKIRNLTDDEILIGSKAIYNHAFNPSTEPGTGALEELPYINEQNATNYKRSKIEAYQMVWDALRTDVSELFLNQFKKLFRIVVSPERPTLYVEEEEDEE